MNILHNVKFRADQIMNFGGNIRLNRVGLAFVVLTCVALIYLVFGIGEKTTGKPAAVNAGATVSLKSLLVASIEIAKRGGKEVKRVREQVDIGEKSKGKTREGANNPFTEGDILSHRQMYYGMKKAFPDVNVISEEEDPEEIDLSTIGDLSRLSNHEVVSVIERDVLVPVQDVDVWIDPLDATQEYTENLVQYVTTMVCVAVNGKPTIGVIHKPFDDVTAWAWSGPDHVSKVVTEEQQKFRHREGLKDTRIIVSRSHKGSVIRVAKEAFGTAGVDVEGAGGAGYKAWEVANGSKDVYVHTTLIKKWDICAGAALLAAVGGKMTTLDGREIDFSGGNPLNEGGVVATVHDHDSYVQKLKGVKP